MAEIAELVSRRCHRLAGQLAAMSGDSYIREAIMRLALQELADACRQELGVRAYEIADHLRYLAERLESCGPSAEPINLEAGAAAEVD